MAPHRPITRRTFHIISVVLGLLATRLGPVFGQAASSTDVITGVLTSEQGQPVADALVEVMSVESQVTRSARTNAKGRYTIVFPDGAGQYRVTVRSIGSAPVQRLLVRQADEDRLVLDIKLSSTPVVLEELRVQARRPGGRGDLQPTPGSTERILTSEQVQRLPIDASDLAMLATLAPGVVSITSTDSSPAGFSVAGQRPTANNVTLDGLTFGGSSVPQDAIRTTRVITSNYDASRGQFSGGLVASTTRAGSNTTQGSANYGFRDHALTVSSGDDAFATGFDQHQLSFGLGGPIARNKLFLFGSALGRFRGDQLQSLLSATPATLRRFGVAPDSATRLLGVLDGLGVPIDDALATGDRQTNETSGLLRFDYLVTQAHTVTIRGDVRRNVQEPTRVGPLSVPASDSRSTSRGGGFMVSVNSRFGTAVINELRAYLSGSSSRAPAEAALPAGRVLVVSALGDQQGASSLSFGGVPGLPQRSSSHAFEASDEISWIPGSGAHRFKLGGFVTRSSSENEVTANQFGTFTFNSIADLEAGLPASFTRTLAPTVRATRQTTAALFAGDTWRVTDALQITLGARIEGSHYGGAPPLNPAALATFGIRTDRWPSEWRLTPRVGFSWFARAADGGPAALVIRGGIGEFRSAAPIGLFSAAQAATGQAGTETQLVCIGDQSPIPDWDAYRLDPTSIPTTCLAGGTGGPPVTRSLGLTGFDPDFTAPRAWRGSLGIQRRRGLVSLGVELSHARGESQFGVTDVNLGPARFSLGDDGRPVFVPSATIDPRTGAAPLFGSRKAGEFGTVYLFDSELASRSTQVTVTANGATSKGAFFSLSYTWNRSRDQSSFAFGGAQRGFGGQTTGGDPNVREWATSDFERRHSLLATVTYPLTRNLEITTIGRLTSGMPYTPMVGEDINGDGNRNDRAFVFGASADTAIANGFARLLATTSSGARDCLERQRDRIALRNSCRGPWQLSLDLQLNYRPTWLGLDRRLTASLVTANLLIGVDQLLHGADGIEGWGQVTRPDNTLLVVRGFDPVANRFLYTVNERFGASASNTVAIRQPFQVGIQLRYTIGPDLLAQFRDGLRGGGRGGPGGASGRLPGAAAPGDMITRMMSLIPDPAAEVIAIRIALRLSDDQVTRLQAISDSLQAETRRLAESAKKELATAGPNPDPGAMFASMRPIFQKVREIGAASRKSVESILTLEQWAQVPDRIKTPRRAGPGGPP